MCNKCFVGLSMILIYLSLCSACTNVSYYFSQKFCEFCWIVYVSNGGLVSLYDFLWIHTFTVGCGCIPLFLSPFVHAI
ncbi:hypothetical protein ACS0TY_034213 [Phlomoides rotata]